MSLVKNIKITKCNNNINHKIIKKYINLIDNNDVLNTFNIDSINDIIPHINNETISFELYNVSSQIANSIRIAILEFIEVKSLTFNYKDLNFNDMYIKNDKLLSIIESIPINQNIKEKEYENWNIYIDVINNTNKNKPILSKEIKIYNKKTKKKIDTSKLFPQNLIIIGDNTFILDPSTGKCLGKYDLFISAIKYMLNKNKKNKVHDNFLYFEEDKEDGNMLTEIFKALKIDKQSSKMRLYCNKKNNYGLQFGKYITLNNINIVKGNKNLNKFPSVSEFKYKIIDNNYKYLLSSPTKFYLSFTTYDNNNSKKLIYTGINYIVNLLNQILDDLKNFKKIPYYSDLLEIYNDTKNTIIQINSNFKIICSVIAKECYINNKKIKYITNKRTHPSDDNEQIVINHNKPIELIVNTIKKLVNKYTIIQSKFTNF